jgi:hypothetical protein
MWLFFFKQIAWWILLRHKVLFLRSRTKQGHQSYWLLARQEVREK